MRALRWFKFIWKFHGSATLEAATGDHADVIRLLASHGAKLNQSNQVLSNLIEIELAALAYYYGVLIVGCDCVVLFVEWHNSSNSSCLQEQYRKCENPVVAAGRSLPDNWGLSLKYAVSQKIFWK